jgi:hypothetical protein
VAPAAGRDVSVRVKNVTVGIRGTDVWGKSSDERDLVCLIEGRVTVAAAGHPPVSLARPRDFYQKPAGAAPQVDRVDEAQLAAWSQETEMPAAAGQEWTVVAANAADRDSARILQRRLRVLFVLAVMHLQAQRQAQQARHVIAALLVAAQPEQVLGQA